MCALLLNSGAKTFIANQFGKLPIELTSDVKVRELLTEYRLFEKQQQLIHAGRRESTLYTSTTHPLAVDFVRHSAVSPGRLALCMCPGRHKRQWQRNLVTDLVRVRDLGAHVLVTLVREEELERMGIADLFQEANSLGLETVSAPITDKWVPSSMQQLLELTDMITNRLATGNTVVVHCNGGKGRAGMVSAAVLVRLGLDPRSAIELVRISRPGTCRNPAQIFYVNVFARSLQSVESTESATPTAGTAPRRLSTAGGGKKQV
jgi:protein-tyrosine phosphatase